MDSKNIKAIGSAIRKSSIRFDLEIIADLIPSKAKILDIGCGSGELLKYLKDNKNTDGRGLEINQSEVSQALRKGISVIHGNAESDLAYYPDSCFDYAILSQTIQSMQNPKQVMEQMLRIAKYAIISLPNFANYKNRLYLLLKGRMPVNKTIPYQWYDTPNIHFCSIKDFEALCLEMSFTIKKKIYFTNETRLDNLTLGNKIIANLFADYGVFLITKNEIRMATEEEFIFNSKSKNPSLKKQMIGLASNNHNKF